MQQAKLLKTAQCVDHGAAAHAGFGGNGVERRIETAGCIIEEVEQQRVKHREGGAANHAAVLPRQVRLAVEAARLLPASSSFLSLQLLKLYLAGGAVFPHRPSGIGLWPQRIESGQDG